MSAALRLPAVPVELRLSGAPLALVQALEQMERHPMGLRAIHVRLGVISPEAFDALVSTRGLTVERVKFEGHQWDRVTYVVDGVTFVADTRMEEVAS